MPEISGTAAKEQRCVKGNITTGLLDTTVLNKSAFTGIKMDKLFQNRIRL
jgi:hypothetical protein